MAGGADVAYPSGAVRLLEEIVAQGVVLSEQEWGTRPQRWMFRRRNRIIAGLAVAVLVVEAGLPSGTFSTADDALAAGREVFAVPGSILSPESRGSNRLISQGATVITDATELMLALSPLLDQTVSQTEQPASATSEVRDELVRALRADPMRPEDAARALGLDVVTTVRRLGALEVSGHVVRFSDGRYGSIG
jgi:DNA processing protein